MNAKIIIAAVVAGGIGLALGAFVGVVVIARDMPSARPVLVLVAVEDLPVGTTVTADMLLARELPQQYVEDRHIPMADLERVVGLRTATGVIAGESILWTDLVHPPGYDHQR